MIYLEKPGAPTVGELEAMKKQAADAGVKVLMGYNKNVCKYVSKVRTHAATVSGSHVTFVSNNTYENNAASLAEKNFDPFFQDVNTFISLPYLSSFVKLITEVKLLKPYLNGEYKSFMISA